ncbi:MAG: hypothetical protein IT376_01230 [Polyangiaceae bacterium]|nr:hypothetical protein [Polyangiaceae bacterium]
MRLAGLVVPMVAAACAGQAQAPGRPPNGASSPERAPSEVAFGEQGWGERAVPSQVALVRLPDAAAWRLDERGTFAEARHAASGSRLVVRAWRAPRIVAPAACEREARLARPDLPPSEGEGVFERRRGVAPSGWDVVVTAGARPATGGAVEGWLVASAATVGRCLVVSLTTVARGPRAEAAIGDRLALFSAGTIDTLAVRTPEDRARP